ncbi:protein argonaute-2-like, partial [Melanaphis sacchari]|uniref:protein argonaute-2-like n=1 Tax=Melanaphis sacchari TaxID=742174 RepID=UPI000DC15330
LKSYLERWTFFQPKTLRLKQINVPAYGKIFCYLQPVFEGQNNTRHLIGNDQIELEITMVVEGRNRIFHIYVKWLTQKSLYLL